MNGRPKQSLHAQRKERKRRKREEARWKRLSGTVTVRFVDPETLRPEDKSG
jgi:hypothetical protein